MIARLLISSSVEVRRKEIDHILSLHLDRGLIAQEGVRTNNHPDLLFFPLDSKLGIAEARIIKEHFSLKPYSAKGRVVILEDGSKLTDEAQNALLKTLEELPAQGLFILGADSESKLLPTILSRCEVIRIQGLGVRVQKDYLEDMGKLLKGSIKERFEYVEKIKEREEFFHSLVSYFHKKLPSNSEFVKELLRSEEWANQNVNIRAILEYLMLVMPKK